MNLEQIESHDFQQWNLVADKAKTQIETRLFIDGDFVDAAAGGCFSTINPANGVVVAELSEGMPEDINKALRMVKNIEAGVVWVNSYEDGDMTQPFGGYKQSGQARDKCLESLKSYTQSKSVWIRLAPE